MSTQNKRLRAPNFTTGEGLQLCSIIERYKNIVENKTTDGASLQQKQEAWIQIAKEYNASGPNFYRSVESLQNCYKKLKQKAKKQHSTAKMNIPVNKEKLIFAIEENGNDNWDAIAMQTEMPKEDCEAAFKILVHEAKKNEADIKKSVMGTGGGPPSNHEDILLDKVKGLIKGSVEGMYTVFDGDSELMAEFSTSDPIDSKTNIEPNSVEDNDSNKKCFELFTTNRANLKRKKDAALTTDSETPKPKKKRDTVLGNFSDLAERKNKLVTSQQELLFLQLKEEKDKNEHNNIMRQMEIEATKLKYLQEEKIREEQLKLLRLEVLLKEKQLNS